MPFLIITRDKPGSAALRAATRPAHLAYITPFAPRLLAAGGFLDDAGEPAGGGMIVFDTDDRAEAEQLVADDPYTQAGLFREVEILRWRKVFFDGRAVG
ncbi:MAG: YciI family protein [Gammaproteobacteria bacterium]